MVYVVKKLKDLAYLKVWYKNVSKIITPFIWEAVNQE